MRMGDQALSAKKASRAASRSARYQRPCRPTRRGRHGNPTCRAASSAGAHPPSAAVEEGRSVGAPDRYAERPYRRCEPDRISGACGGGAGGAVSRLQDGSRLRSQADWIVLLCRSLVRDARRGPRARAALQLDRQCGCCPRVRDGRRSQNLCTIRRCRPAFRPPADANSWSPSSSEYAGRSRTGELTPTAVRLVHRGSSDPSEFESFVGCHIDFGADADEIVFDRQARSFRPSARTRI